VASRDAARNRSPGRPGAPPARQYDLAARSSLHGLRGIMPQTEARPPATNRHGGAPKGARPTLLDAGRFASARACSVIACPTGCRCTRAPVGAPPTPQGGNSIQHPGAIAPRERIGLFEIVRWECGARRANDAFDRPHALMSHVKPRRRNHPSSPQTRERCRCDDRATVGAKPRDVGQQTLIRGFTHVRLSVWGCPGLRTGVDLAIGLTA
jgi:hypothetical protein